MAFRSKSEYHNVVEFLIGKLNDVVCDLSQPSVTDVHAVRLGSPKYPFLAVLGTC